MFILDITSYINGYIVYSFGIIDDWCCNDPFSDLPIHFDEQFSCLGNETSIFDCLLDGGLEQLGEHDCSHDEDMYVYCKG